MPRPGGPTSDRPSHCCHEGRIQTGSEAATPTTFLRMHWHTAKLHPTLTVFVQLTATMARVNTAQEVQAVLQRVGRPRSPGDVLNWLGLVGATYAEWRVEVEARPPYSITTIPRPRAGAWPARGRWCTVPLSAPSPSPNGVRNPGPEVDVGHDDVRHRHALSDTAPVCVTLPG
jgi:hypothetical protein